MLQLLAALMPAVPVPGSDGRLLATGACPEVWPPQAPCAANPSRLRSLREAASTTMSLPRYYLLDDGVFDLDAAVQCFFANVGDVSQAAGRLDTFVPPDVDEMAYDSLLLKKLRTHPSRTADASEAAFFIVGSPLFTAWQAGQLVGSPCGSPAAHYAQMDAIAANLTQMPEFAATAGRNFVLGVPSFYLSNTLGEQLMQLLQDGPMTLMTTDRDLVEVNAIPGQQPIVMPFKATAGLENAALDDSSLRETRAVDFMFRGTEVRRCGTPGTPDAYSVSGGQEGCLRDVVFNLARKLGSGYKADVQNIQITGAGGSVANMTKSAMPGIYKTVKATEAAYLASAFCFIPAGDVPSSRRLFDGLAAGCIPIVMDKVDDICPDVPFNDTIDWGSVALFAGSLQCIADNMDATVRWLEQLATASRQGCADVSELRAAGVRAFVDGLSYAAPGDGMVSALLRQLAANPTPTRASLALVGDGSTARAGPAARQSVGLTEVGRAPAQVARADGTKAGVSLNTSTQCAVARMCPEHCVARLGARGIPSAPPCNRPANPVHPPHTLIFPPAAVCIGRSGARGLAQRRPPIASSSRPVRRSAAAAWARHSSPAGTTRPAGRATPTWEPTSPGRRSRRSATTSAARRGSSSSPSVGGRARRRSSTCSTRIRSSSLRARTTVCLMGVRNQCVTARRSALQGVTGRYSERGERVGRSRPASCLQRLHNSSVTAPALLRRRAGQINAALTMWEEAAAHYPNANSAALARGPVQPLNLLCSLQDWFSAVSSYEPPANEASVRPKLPSTCLPASPISRSRFPISCSRFSRAFASAGNSRGGGRGGRGDEGTCDPRVQGHRLDGRIDRVFGSRLPV